MRIEKFIICEMVDKTYKAIKRNNFEFNKSDVIRVIDFIDNYSEANAKAARLNKRALLKFIKK